MIDFLEEKFMEPGIKDIETSYNRIDAPSPFKMTDFFNLTVSIKKKDVFCSKCPEHESDKNYTESIIPVAYHRCDYKKGDF